MKIFLNSLNSCSVIPLSSKNTRPWSGRIRDRKVSITARGCSNISFSMKWRYPAFSAWAGDQLMVASCHSFSRQSRSKTPNSVPLKTAWSPSSKKMTRLV